MPRDHRLRERRLKLGKSQYEIGCLAFFPVRGAQSRVSNAELHKSQCYTRDVRRALIWLEMEPRRKRESEKAEALETAAIAAALSAPRCQESEVLIINRMVDLLMNGRGEDFDDLGALVEDGLVKFAGDLYLDLSTPTLA